MVPKIKAIRQTQCHLITCISLIHLHGISCSEIMDTRQFRIQLYHKFIDLKIYMFNTYFKVHVLIIETDSLFTKT